VNVPDDAENEIPFRVSIIESCNRNAPTFALIATKFSGVRFFTCCILTVYLRFSQALKCTSRRIVWNSEPDSPLRLLWIAGSRYSGRKGKKITRFSWCPVSYQCKSRTPVSAEGTRSWKNSHLSNYWSYGMNWDLLHRSVVVPCLTGRGQYRYNNFQ